MANISRVQDLLSLSMSSGSHLDPATLVLARLLRRLLRPCWLCALQLISSHFTFSVGQDEQENPDYDKNCILLETIPKQNVAKETIMFVFSVETLAENRA